MLLKFVLRNFKKRLFLNLIKVIGLASGLTGILFIAFFIKNEFSYDGYHQNVSRIYRLTVTAPDIFNGGHFARTEHAVQAPHLAEYFPEVANYVRLEPIRSGVMMYDKKYYTINEAFECDSTFFKIFDAELLRGDKETVLSNPASMVISETFAKRVFGNTDPLGKTLSIPEGQRYPEEIVFTVQGVMKDFPQNSHFHPDLITRPASKRIEWFAYTYLLLTENGNQEKITSGYPKFLSERYNEPFEAIQAQAHMQKLTDIHLRSDKLREIEPNGNMTNLYMLGVAALILLVISMSNYASLNLGMAGFNTKFLTMNRILGSTDKMSLNYFVVESLLIIFLSVGLTAFFLLPVHAFIKNRFDVDLLKGNILTGMILVLIFALLVIFSGLQPVLKKRFYKGRFNENLLRSNKIVVNKGIVITQYAFAIVLLIAVLVITLQMHFVLNNSMGNEKDNIVCFELVHADVQKNFETFKSELVKHNSIESVTAMFEPPGGETNDMFEFEIEGSLAVVDEANNLIDVFPCDYSFISLFGLTFLSGENFSQDNIDAEGSGEYILNEAAVKLMGFANANELIGKKFKLLSPIPDVQLPEGKIVGVVKDFHLSNMKKKIEPMVLFKRRNMWLLNFAVAYKPEKRTEALADIEKVWMSLFPAYPFHYEHLGTMYNKEYKTELLQSNLLTVFTFVSLFICSMGLLGMSLLISRQRVKEISIRKVNGAQVTEILALLNKNFIKWILAAFIIAVPIAWYAMNKWLENFAYKINLSWWIFAVAGLFALGIAVLTVTWQSWKTATQNPVKALRHE